MLSPSWRELLQNRCTYAAKRAGRCGTDATAPQLHFRGSSGALFSRSARLARPARLSQLFVGRIPGRTASDDPLRHTEPLRYLGVVGSHPVYRNRRQPPLFAFARKAEPPGAVLRGHGSACPDCGPPIAEDTLLDKIDGVFYGGAPLKLPAFNSGWVYHPHFPRASARIFESSISCIVSRIQRHVPSPRYCLGCKR
jgi:hypothetical protein